MPPRIRRGRNPEGSRLSLRAVAAPSAGVVKVPGPRLAVGGYVKVAAQTQVRAATFKQ